ncbi:uncharacterized protein LOC121910324 isoform X2 [Thunnus maccoyii]|uniref:uncharacterized protein LOC121910324 isoform X2 n=1 Tax=Thunnus maccoyii TaxID=8240 RepID=UPI001C4DAE92|nr:uncharacterized protein LOC121910324 isoform X2 [Thunnus maccoyii]
MKISVFFPLLLLVCSVSTDPIKKKADNKLIDNLHYEPIPYHIHGVLIEMTASLAEQKVEMRHLQKDKYYVKNILSLFVSFVLLLKILLHIAQTEKLKELDKLQTEADKQKQQLQARQVAFSAALSAEGSKTLGPYETHTNLVFEYVATNIGCAYNSNTGIFTAPVRGAYHFEFYIGVRGDNHHPSAGALVKNQDHVFSAFEKQTSHYGSTSNGGTLILEVGDPFEC